MEPLNDDELHDLLRQWEAPAAPLQLERRIFGGVARRLWYHWLLTGSVRVPVPAMVLLLMLVISSALTLVFPGRRRSPHATAREISLSEFQPVTEMKLRIIRRSYEGN